MAGNSKQKLKLLYLLKILTERSDEEHCLGAQALIDALAEYGIRAERKSIYDDIAQLIEFGYDIGLVKARTGGGYYLSGREFELAELKLLVETVQASRFLTVKKSRELIGKIEKLASKAEAGQLQRQVYVAGRIKTGNESIYYNIDTIHRAIQENRQITFQYLDWNLKKELVPAQPWIIHGFTGKPELARQLVAAGFGISLGHRAAPTLREIIPAEHRFEETDL